MFPFFNSTSTTPDAEHQKNSPVYCGCASCKCVSKKDRDKSASKERHCRKPELSCTQSHLHRARRVFEMMRRSRESVQRSRERQSGVQLWNSCTSRCSKSQNKLQLVESALRFKTRSHTPMHPSPIAFCLSVVGIAMRAPPQISNWA